MFLSVGAFQCLYLWCFLAGFCFWTVITCKAKVCSDFPLNRNWYQVMIQYIYVSFCWRSAAEAECCKILVNTCDAGGGCNFRNTAAVVSFQTGGICDDETVIQQQASWEPGSETETTLCSSFTFLLQQSSITSETHFLLLTNQSVCNHPNQQTWLPQTMRVSNMRFTCCLLDSLLSLSIRLLLLYCFVFLKYLQMFYLPHVVTISSRSSRDVIFQLFQQLWSLRLFQYSVFKRSSNECRHRFSSLFVVFKVCTHTRTHAHMLSIHTVAPSHKKLCGVKWIPYFTSAYFPGSFWCLPAVSHLQICVSCPELKRPVGSRARFPCLRARPDPAQALLRLVSEACNLILDPSVRDTDLRHQGGRRARCLTLTKSVRCRQKTNSSVHPPSLSRSWYFRQWLLHIDKGPGRPSEGKRAEPQFV